MKEAARKRSFQNSKWVRAYKRIRENRKHGLAYTSLQASALILNLVILQWVVYYGNDVQFLLLRIIFSY